MSDLAKRLREEASASEELHPEDSHIAVMREAANRLDDEYGWVIERHINSQLCYWAGRSIDVAVPRAAIFSPKNEDAIRFARAADASVVLAWLLNGNGRVAEHVWTGAAKAAS